MLSRVADSIYWMTRYIERAENAARLIDVNLHLTLDLPDGALADPWTPLISATGDDAAFAAAHGAATRATVTAFLTADERSPNSIVACLSRARENARSVREVISSEMWKQVNRSYLEVQEAVADGRATKDPHAFYTGVKEACHLFAGIMHATMSHNEAWHFGRLGMMMERADQTSRIVDMKHALIEDGDSRPRDPVDDLQWAAVLKSASAFEMYRKGRRRRIMPVDVVDFLLFDARFPRSVRFSVDRAASSLHAIMGAPEGTHRMEAEKRLGRLQADLGFMEIADVVREGLHRFVDRVQTRLNDAGEAITEAFFEPRGAVVANGAGEALQ